MLAKSVTAMVAGRMTMSDAFAARMAQLDALVERCRAQPPFAGGIVRDTSNRSGRDWPWWSIEVERSHGDGLETRRISATVRLNATQDGDPGSFEGEWRARIWQGVGADSFRGKGGWPLEWTQPGPEDLREAVNALLDAASAAIPASSRPQGG